CSHINQLDFSGCGSLLHPTVFCCLKDFAPRITHLLFEDCDVMTDDSVQIILMCCPKLEHLNISSCKSITDEAFTFSSSSDSNKLSLRAQQAGRKPFKSHSIKHGTSNTPLKSSLDEQWMLAWQQIDDDESCNDNDELFDSMWSDEPVFVDSVMSAFGGVISSLTNALVDLDLCDANYDDDDDDDDDDDINPVVSMETVDTRVHDSPHTNDIDQDKDSKLHVVGSTLPLGGPLKGNDDNDSNPVVPNKNVNCTQTPGDSNLTCETDKHEDDAKFTGALPPSGDPPKGDLCASDIAVNGLSCKSDSQSDITTCTVSATEHILMTFDDSNNETEQLDNDNCNIHALTVSDKHDGTATCSNDNDNHDFHSNKEEDLEVSLDEADELLAQILNVHELSSDDLVSPLHGFNDALASLTNAMVDLINTGDSDNDDGDAGDDDDDDDDGDDDDEISQKIAPLCHDSIDNDGTTNEELSACHQCCHGDYNNSNDPTTRFHGDHASNNHNPIRTQDDGICTPRDTNVFHCFHNNNSEYKDSNDVNDTFGDEDNGSREVCKVESLYSLTMEHVNLVILPQDNASNLNFSETAAARDAEQGTHGLQSCNESVRNDTDLVETNGLQLSCTNNTAVISSVKAGSMLNLTHEPRIRAIDISNIYFHSKALGVACLKMFTDKNRLLNSFATSWTELDDDALISVVKNEPELRSLTLIDCEKITNRSLKLLPVHCPRLEKIDLKGVPFITDHGVVPMLSSPCLQTLSLAEASVTDISMYSIAEKCGEKLRDLDLSWCEDLTDKGMSAVATSCSGLRSLALRQCAASYVTIATLSSCCHGLTSLNVAGIHQLTDQMVATMATSMPNLTFVDLSWNSGLTSVGVGALMSNCSRLEEAILSGLKALTSKPFLAIIGDLPRWRAKQEVMLRRRFKSQQNGGPVETLIKPCSMEMAKSLGDDLPFRSTTHCPVLRHLVLEYSDKVNDDHLSQIVAVCRGTLSIRDYYSQPIEPKW
ncbi:hypothetical protein QZH41_018189, partial [Actinostola sp. cb2023]